MNHDEAMQFLHEAGYVVEEVDDQAWKIRNASGEVVGRVAGEDMLIAFVVLLKAQQVV